MLETESKKRTIRRYKTAVNVKDGKDFKSCYAYVCPRRYPGSDNDRDVPVELLDSTATDSANSRAAKLHNQLFPPFREWIDPLPTITIPKEMEKAWEEHRTKVKENIHKALEVSNFHEEIEDALLDSLISDGALALHRGDAENPFIFEAADWDSFFTENDYKHRPSNVFFRRFMCLDELLFNWPKAEIPTDLQDKKDDYDKKYEVMDCYLYDDRRDKYSYEVWLVDGEHLIFKKDNEDTSLWTIFRFNKKMRSNVGYGPIRDVMPDIRTANKVMELILKNGAIAVSGMWQADDDGVVNIANLKIEPGVIIPKDPSSKGLVPLETNRNFDVSQFILADQQEKIKTKIMGNPLPQIKDGVRSAAEYYLRKEEQTDREVPVASKMSAPQDNLLSRMYAILTSPTMKSSPYYIEPFSFTVEGRKIPIKVKIKAANPLIKLQSSVDANNDLKSYMSLLQIFGEQALSEVKVSKFMRKFLIDNDFDQDLLTTDKEKEENAKAQQAMQEQQLALMAAQKEQAKAGKR